MKRYDAPAPRDDKVCTSRTMPDGYFTVFIAGGHRTAEGRSIHDAFTALWLHRDIAEGKVTAVPVRVPT